MIFLFHLQLGPRYVVQLGDKTVDYNEEFRLFMATRNPHPDIPPDAANILSEVNFTTTRAGLRGQVRIAMNLKLNLKCGGRVCEF